MSAVVSAISSAVSSIGHAVESAGKFVGKTLESVAQGAVKNPIGTLARVAAISTGQVWALPIISAVDTIAHGGNIGQAVLNAGASYVGSWVAGADGLNVANAVGGGTVGDLATGLVRGGVTSAISGKDIVSGALSGAIEQGVGGALGRNLSSDVLGGALGATGGMLLGKTLGGATSAAIQGKDVEQGAASGLAGGLFNWGANGFNNTLSNVSDYVNNTGGNEQLQAQVDNLRAMGDDYQNTYKTASDSYNQYNDLAKQYNDTLNPLVTNVHTAQSSYDQAVQTYNATYQKYQDAVNAGDTATAEGLVKTLEDQYADYQSKEKALTDSYDVYSKAKEENANLLNDATNLKATYDSSVTKLEDLKTQAAQGQKDLESNVSAYTDTLNRQGLEGASQELQNAQQPFAQFAGTQTFDDGSSIQTFDDGSMLITDSAGNISSVDASGDSYDQQGNPTTAGDSKAKDYSSVFRSLMAGAGRSRSFVPRSNKAIGKGLPSVSRGTAHDSAAGALGLGAASALGAGEGESQAPLENKATSYNPYDFLNEKSHMTYIPGVSDALGFKGANNQGINTILGGAGPKPQAYGFIPQEEEMAPQGSALQQASFGYQQPNIGQISGYESPAGTPAIDPYAVDYAPFAHGGSVFMSEGGAQNYVRGGESGTADTVDAKLSTGEFVLSSDVVSAIGNGNNEAGASILERFVREIRAHKQENGTELPPDAKSPLEYLKMAGMK